MINMNWIEISQMMTRFKNTKIENIEISRSNERCAIGISIHPHPMYKDYEVLNVRINEDANKYKIER